MPLTKQQIEQLATEAIDIMMATDDDSFGITNAVRCLTGYDSMTPDERAAINQAATRQIMGG